jgi:adenylate cyclase
MRSRLRSWRAAVALVAIIIAGTWGAFLGVWHLQGRASLLDRAEGPMTDWRLLIAGERSAPEGIVIVAIDDETVRRVGSHPLPRALLAELVNRLTESAAKAIALDMLFLDPGPADADAQLAKAIRHARAVIGAVALFPRGDAFSDTSLGSGLSLALPLAERCRRSPRPVRSGSSTSPPITAARHATYPC